MKYLLYYKLDSNFIADQTSVGGDGAKVVSVVDGVAWTNDQEKTYYRLANNDSENLTSYTVTVHYKSRSNKILAPDDVYVVDAYVGKGVKETITAKGISGCTALNDSEELTINDNAEYTFYYKVKPDNKKPLTFNIISAGTIVWKAQNTAYKTTIEYSTDSGETWTSITSNTGASAPSISVNAGDVVQFRGNNATYSSGGSRHNSFSGSTAKFDVEGNIMSLIDSTNFATATTLASSYTFYYLFRYCANLTSAENLVLPATTLASNCYGYMFYGCTSLTSAPELPATTLADYCYGFMFWDCTSLTAAPVLPATTLVSNCYAGMFWHCTSLTTAPVLPATTLANGCYSAMFIHCKKLNYIECLATDISAVDCTTNWVNDVSSIGTFVKPASMTSWLKGVNGIPENWTIINYGFRLSRPIITLSEIASAKTVTITSPFNNWTATTEDNWYGLSEYTGGTGETTITITANTQDIFRTGTVTFTDGTNVETLTVNEKHVIETPLTFNIISTGTIYWKAYSNSYRKSIQYKKNNGEWTSITATTEGTSISVNAGDVVQFKGNNETYATGTSMYNTFSGTTARFDVEGNIMSLIDSTNFATATTLTSNYIFCRLFCRCTGLTSTENLVLPATRLIYYCYSGMFYGCTSLTTAPSILPATTLESDCYYTMFSGCTSLTTAPELPATTLADWCYASMFYGCTGLISAPELPASAATQNCYSSMFADCTSLTTAPSILPATTLAISCYSNMFAGCTSLTTAPSILPATTLAYGCYGGMFARCSSLTSAPALPATTLAESCYGNMFGECTSLISVPELPATTLANYCYGSMFAGCTGLISAPELPATTLVSNCYKGMFSGCTSLNYIKCLATDISAVDCTTSWTRSVSSTGTFVKNANMSSWTTGRDGIPNNWTVQDA